MSLGASPCRESAKGQRWKTRRGLQRNSWIVIQCAVHYAGISHMKYFVGFAILAGCAAWAQQQTKLPDQGFTDTPILPGLKWHVHDPARPHPPVVTPGVTPGAPPSDAIVLF